MASTAAMHQDQIDPLYRRLWSQRERHGWSAETLQEALRQEWELWYGKRVLKENTPPTLRDLLFLAENPPVMVKVMKRRRLHP